MQRTIHLATNLGRGGISALILTGTATDMQLIDNTLPRLTTRSQPLHTGELLYDVVIDSKTASVIDEIVIAAYSPKIRIITGHGGSASALALLDYYRALGFTESKTNPLVNMENNTRAYIQSLLPHTRTDIQAYKCLQTLQKLDNAEEANLEEIVDILQPRIVVLAGAPNVGKSSLLNLLCGFERVLVSTVAGTTRDAVRDYIDISGYYTHIIDTAGFRSDAGISETEAINRAEKLLTTADVILLLFDGSREFASEDLQALDAVKNCNNARILPVINKCDCEQKNRIATTYKEYNLPQPLQISCTSNTGVNRLLQEISLLFTHNRSTGNEQTD